MIPAILMMWRSVASQPTNLAGVSRVSVRVLECRVAPKLEREVCVNSAPVKISGGKTIWRAKLFSRWRKAWFCLAGMLLLAPLQALAAVSVTVNPSSVNMVPSGTQQLTATVTGASDTSVTWTIQEGAAGGSVTSAGLYSAPATVGIYHVTATSNADPTKSATTTIGLPGFVQTGLLYPGPTMSALLPNGTILFTGGGLTNGTPTTNAEIYDPVAAKSTTTGSMTINHGFGTATLLANGKVLFAGGESAGQTATAEIYDPAVGTFAATGSMSVARVGHTATLLPNGTVLIAGGGNCNSGCVSFNTAELYDPSSGTFSRTTGNMVVSHSNFDAVLLANGKVLLMGGTESSTDSTGTNITELYDPSTGLFTATGTMITGRQQAFTATLLQNGNVLVAGGVSSGVSIALTEVYSTSAGTFSATGSLTQPLDGHSATLLANGQVLIAGGISTTTFANASELYDPLAGTFTATGSLEEPRFSSLAILLGSGKVMVAGGGLPTAIGSIEIYDPGAGIFSSTSTFMHFSRTGSTVTKLADGRFLFVGGLGLDGNPVLSAEIFDPATNKFSLTGALAAGRQMHTATLLGNGTVLVVGGFPNSLQTSYVSSAEIYNPVSGTFGAAPSNPNITRANHTVTLLPNGKVLIAGGQSNNGPFGTTSVELYDPVAGAFTLAGNMTAPRANHTATLLSDGRVLIAEGIYNASTGTYAPDELYDFSTGSFTPVGAPTNHNTSVAPPSPFDSVQWPSGQVLVDYSTILDPSSLSLSSFDPHSADGISKYKFALLPSSQVFLVGGPFTGTQVFLLNPNPALYPQQDLPTYLNAGNLRYVRSSPSLGLLPNGEVLIAAGANVREAEFYVAPVAATDPVISSITPNPITGFNPVPITVQGSNFATAAGISLDGNGTPLPTTFVSSTQLTATIPALYLTNPGAHTIAVQNGTGFNSAPFTLTVNNPRLPVSQPNGSGINYGEVPAVGFSSQTVNFTNTGNVPLTIDSVNISGTNTADFKFDSQNTSCPLQGGALGPQQQCNAVILFEPLANASYSASLNFVYEQLPGSPVVVPLTGIGVGQTSSTITPNTLSFGNQAVGTSSETQSLTITNTGTTNWTLASVVLSDTANFSTSNTCTSNGGNVSPTMTCAVTLTFHPTTVGNISASAVITSNQAIPYTIPLSGAGVNFSLSAASGSSTSATVAAGQTATFQLTLAPQSLTGSVALTCAPVTVIPNATCSVSPNPATVSGSSPTVITVSVVTMAHSGLASPFAMTKGPGTELWDVIATHWAFYGLALLGLTLASFKTRRAPFALATALLVITLAVGCGTYSSSSSGGGSTGTGGTTAGNYQLVISATSAGATRTIMLNLTVQ